MTATEVLEAPVIPPADDEAVPDEGRPAERESALVRLRRLAAERAAAAEAPERTPAVDDHRVEPAASPAPAPDPVIMESAAEPVFVHDPEPVEPEPVEPEPVEPEPAEPEPAEPEPAEPEPVEPEPVVDEAPTGPQPVVPAAPVEDHRVEPAARPAPDADTVITEPRATAARHADPDAEPRGPARTLIAVLVGVTVVASGLSAWGATQLDDHTNQPKQSADASRQAAQAAAAQTVQDLFTVDYHKGDDWLARVSADSTGPIITDYKNKEQVLFTLLANTQTMINARALRASADFTNPARTTASSLVVATQHQTDKSHPAGVTQVLGYQVNLALKDGKWLATAVQPVGTTVS